MNDQDSKKAPAETDLPLKKGGRLGVTEEEAIKAPPCDDGSTRRTNGESHAADRL